MRKHFTSFIFIIFIGFSAFGQSQDIYEKYNIYRPPFRVFMNKFSWTLTSGYGQTQFKHSLGGYYFFQDPDQQLIIRNDLELGPTFDGYAHWVGDPVNTAVDLNEDLDFDVPYQYIENPVNNEILINDQYLVDADTIDLGFERWMPTVPVMLSVHYQINENWRIGFGFQYERIIMKRMQPFGKSTDVNPYQPAFNKTRNNKWFLTGGYKFYEYWDWSFVGELQLGIANRGPEINTSAIGIGQKLMVNAGVSIEYNMSEYFRIVVRPSYDFKQYTMNIPDGTDIRHRNQALMVQAGVSFNIPEIPRSPIKSDHVQLKHVITDPRTGQAMEVRGQPFWKKQNPKVGENHRKLWRYKWRNKRKIDPY